MPTPTTINSTTQQFLDIYDITNNLVILKDGTTSLIITVDAMNFGLLAEEEQDSIMYAYAGLLNSLNYPIQIIVKSQTKDVTGYLRLLKDQEDATVSREQQQRIAKYREFVSNLIRERNVLDKKFYIAIPAKSLELGLIPPASVIPGKGETDISTVDKTMILEKAKNILEPKRDHLIAQFARIGLYSRQLETQEIIQLFYQSYNPEASEGQEMDDSKNYTSPLVSASIEDSHMNIADINNQSIVSNQQTQTTEQTTTPSYSNPTTANNQRYSPAQMQEVQQTETTITTTPSQEAQVLPVLNTNKVILEEPTSATPNQTSIVSAPINALPPAPELPKAISGQTDHVVPKETEIIIQHPGEATISTNPILDTPPQTEVLPPLPEIK